MFELTSRTSADGIGMACQVRFSGCGERFAAVGEGGLLGAWRLDAPRRGGLGRADWAMQVCDEHDLRHPSFVGERYQQNNVLAPLCISHKSCSEQYTASAA